jgi:Protein of unknown function (DUF3800)
MGRGGQEAGGVLQCRAMTERFYAYLDESGQETEGRIFIVGAVVVESGEREALLDQLHALEARSRKGRVKWHRARFAHRQAYMAELANLTQLARSMYLIRFTRTQRYPAATAEAAARAIRARSGEACRVRVVVDGLKREERRRFGDMLRQRQVRPDDVRGARDQSDAFIRLADAACGLARDAEDGQAWAVQAMQRLKRRGLIVEL